MLYAPKSTALDDIEGSLVITHSVTQNLLFSEPNAKKLSEDRPITFKM